ncbi:MAG: flippase-like domain-containing protein [Thermoplasmatales archaeon]|nr:flippase-like domain-containing protein [Thermoplasmatales archaeon]
MIERINIKKISKLFPIIGIILLIYIIIDIGTEKIVYTFISIPIQFYALALLLFIPRLFLSSYKWQYICRKQKMDFSLLYLAKIFLITLFLGSVTPGSIGLHLRIHYLKEKSKASLEKCIANSLTESALALIAGLFLALIGSVVLIDKFPELIFILLPFFIFYTSAFVVLIKKGRGNRIFNIFIRPLIPAKFKETVNKSIESLYKDIPRLRDTLFPFLIEILIWVVAASQVYIIAQAFSIEIPYFLFVLISIISVIISNVLPISIGGLGIREGTFVFLMSKFGVDPEIAFVISLSGFMVKILIPGLIGLIISFGMGKRVIKPTNPL